MNRFAITVTLVVMCSVTGYSQGGFTRSGAYWVPNRMITPLPPQARQHYYPNYRPQQHVPVQHPPSLQVADVTDGDTFTLTNGLTVRLYNVDAPEMQQIGGLAAKSLLSNWLLGNYVRLNTHGRDKYGRILAEVYLNGRYVNEELVAAGGAWDSSGVFGKQDQNLASAESRAKAGGLGIWANPLAKPPWEFRDEQQALQGR